MQELSYSRLRRAEASPSRQTVLGPWKEGNAGEGRNNRVQTRTHHPAVRTDRLRGAQVRGSVVRRAIHRDHRVRRLVRILDRRQAAQDHSGDARSDRHRGRLRRLARRPQSHDLYPGRPAVQSPHIPIHAGAGRLPRPGRLSLASPRMLGDAGESAGARTAHVDVGHEGEARGRSSDIAPAVPDVVAPVQGVVFQPEDAVATGGQVRADAEIREPCERAYCRRDRRHGL